MSKSVTFTSSTYHLLDFSMAVYCRDKRLTVWAFFSLFHSVGYSIYDGVVILLLGLYVPTKLAL